MWTTISNILLQLIINIISDKVVMDVAKKLINRAVNSKTKGIGITNNDVQDILTSVAKSTLNTFINEGKR